MSIIKTLSEADLCDVDVLMTPGVCRMRIAPETVVVSLLYSVYYAAIVVVVVIILFGRCSSTIPSGI